MGGDQRERSRRLLAFLQPNPVLEISTGRRPTIQGQFAYSLSGINPDEVYAVAGQADAEDECSFRDFCS